VHAMRLDEDDEIIDMCPLNAGTQVLAITTLGYGKRTDPDEYREQGRNGKGIRAMNLTDKTGDLTALLLVNPDEDIMLITDDGTIIRSAVEDVRLCGRFTQGVRLMKLAEGSRVVGVARADKEEPEEELLPDDAETEETPTGEEI